MEALFGRLLLMLGFYFSRLRAKCGFRIPTKTWPSHVLYKGVTENRAWLFVSLCFQLETAMFVALVAFPSVSRHTSPGITALIRTNAFLRYLTRRLALAGPSLPLRKH